jgi:maleylacetoacetate isomerase
MKLYDYFRSSAAYRVRIALNLKGVAPERAFVHLRRGAQRADEYLAMNPQGLVPSLVTDAGDVLTQSLAIIEWLEETYPQPPLLPSDAAGRRAVRSLALAIACDIHPAQQPARAQLPDGHARRHDAQRDGWCPVLVRRRPRGARDTLARGGVTGAFCHGTAPTIADVCLVPQLANARRVDLDLAPYPTLLRIESACIALPAFAAAAPQAAAGCRVKRGGRA